MGVAVTTRELAIPTPRVALVDDRPGRVNLALRVLAGARYRARAFTSLEQAFDVLTTTRFDVVVTDHRMGGHDASELCAHLRGRFGVASPPVVLVTRSVHDVAIRDRELFAGILIKPLSPKALLTALARALELEGPSARNGHPRELDFDGFGDVFRGARLEQHGIDSGITCTLNGVWFDLACHRDESGYASPTIESQQRRDLPSIDRRQAQIQ